MKHSVRNQCLILSGLLLTFFFTWSSAFSLFSIWLNQYVGLKGAETGATFSAIAITALCAQPLYGVIQDKLGLKKHLLWAIGILLLISGPFFIYVYAPYCDCAPICSPVRIFASGLAQDATTISLMKLLHAVELPILLIAMFKYIAANCDPRLSATLYLVGFQFVTQVCASIFHRWPVKGLPSGQ